MKGTTILSKILHKELENVARFRGLSVTLPEGYVEPEEKPGCTAVYFKKEGEYYYYYMLDTGRLITKAVPLEKITCRE